MTIMTDTGDTLLPTYKAPLRLRILTLNPKYGYKVHTANQFIQKINKTLQFRA